MNQNRPLHKKKEFISKPLKILIAVASVASTLGLWGIFGQGEAQGSIVQGNETTMPTVATLVDAGISNVSSSSNNSGDTSLNNLPIVTQAPVSTVSAVPTAQYYPPAPITSTRSSR